MLDVAFSELALIVVAAFLILGPKEFPTVIRALSRFMRQCREVIDECKSQLDGLADDAGMTEAKAALKGETKRIKDQFGQWQDTYDLSDILIEQEADTAADLPHAEPAPASKKLPIHAQNDEDKPS